MPAGNAQPWLVTLLTSPAFVFLCCIIIGSCWMIYFILSGRQLPLIRGKHKDTEIEFVPAPVAVDPATSAAPSANEEATPGDDDKTPTTPTNPKSDNEVAFDLLMRLYAKRDEGLFALKQEWEAIRAQAETLPEPDRQNVFVRQPIYRLELGDDTAIGELVRLAQEKPPLATTDNIPGEPLLEHRQF